MYTSVLDGTEPAAQFSSLSAQSDRFPMLSTSLGHPDPPAPEEHPASVTLIPSAVEGSAGLPCPGFQVGRHTGELTCSHPIHPFAETTALWYGLVPPRQAGKGGCFDPYTEQFVIYRCQCLSQSWGRPGSAPQRSHMGYGVAGGTHRGVPVGQVSFECHIIS